LGNRREGPRKIVGETLLSFWKTQRPQRYEILLHAGSGGEGGGGRICSAIINFLMGGGAEEKEGEEGLASKRLGRVALGKKKSHEI